MIMFPYWDMEIRGNLILSFSYLFRNNMYYKGLPRSKETKFCVDVICFLEKSYKEPINSSIIAQEFHYNQSYFCRLFKKSFGMCFNDYLCEFRLNKAKGLLKRDVLSITTIVYETGFTDTSYFSKCFKNKYGVSPKHYADISKL